MKNTIAILFISALLFSCGGSKKAANAVSSGNYHEAFELAATNLRKDKTKSSSQKNVPILKEAYNKSAINDKIAITQLKKNNSKNNLYLVYQKYLMMDVRQDEVMALQPLYFEGKEYTFNFKDYSKNINKSKNALSKFLYDESRTLLSTGKKGDARIAFKNLEELYYDINADYKSDIRSLLDKAKATSSSFVLVTLNNKITNQLQDSTSRSEIAQFKKINAANFDNPWVIYHDKKDYNVKYDYSADFSLDKLQFVPEKVNQEKVAQQKKVQDGWKYKYDAKGNVMKDKEGNDIKEAKYVIVKAEVMLYQQVKSVTINGTLVIKNTKNGSIISTHPLTGEAKLENVYAKYRGDQRAIDQKYHKALQSKEAKFPKDEVFKKYALDNLKKQAMGILNQQKF